MEIQYHGQQYNIEQKWEAQVTAWLAARELRGDVYRKLDQSGRPLSGNRNEVYPDDAARDGYQIIPIDEQVLIGEVIRVGTGYLNNGSMGRVTRIGDAYSMTIDQIVADEDHSYSGKRITGHQPVYVKRIYFEDHLADATLGFATEIV